MLTTSGRMALDDLRSAEGLDPKLPWGGRSPRALTSAHERFRLKREKTTVNEGAEWDEAVVDQQYRRFIYDVELRRVREGRQDTGEE